MVSASSFLASSLWALGALAVGRASPRANVPAAPPTKFLFTVNIVSPTVIQLGETPLGHREFQPVTGGNFSGPGISGKVVGGLDYGLVDGAGHFNPDVVLLLQTADGCNILLREQGHAPNEIMQFETACDEYDEYNAVVAYGKGTQVTGGITLDVWRIGTYAD